MAGQNKKGFYLRIISESVLIIFSILLALAVDRWREDREKEEVRQQALSNITMEIQQNISALDIVIPYHDEVADKLREYLKNRPLNSGQNAFEMAIQVAPQGIQTPDLQSAAWETAMATGAVGLIDYQLTQAIARVYAYQQETVIRTIYRLDENFLKRETFDVQQSRETMDLMNLLINELLNKEQILKFRLGNVLKELRS